MIGLDGLPEDSPRESEEMLLDILDQSEATDSSIEECKSSCSCLSKNPPNNDVHGYRYLVFNIILAVFSQSHQ